MESSDPAEKQLSSQVFIDEARRIVDEGKKKNITLRVMGALAIRIHSLDLAEFHKKLKRLGPSGQEFTDIDLVTTENYRNKMKPFFQSINYVPDKSEFIIHMWALRHIYHEKNNNLHIDVFFDKLDMSHTIDFRHRLEVDYPTIPLAELLLEKLQIVQINEKDIKDSITLLRVHPIGDHDKETINAKRIAELLASDWGFWYTVTMNFDKVKNFATNYCKENLIAESDLNDVSSKIDQMTQMIESEPKSLKWKMRAKVGPQKKWYRDVEEIQR